MAGRSRHDSVILQAYTSVIRRMTDSPGSTVPDLPDSDTKDSEADTPEKKP